MQSCSSTNADSLYSSGCWGVGAKTRRPGPGLTDAEERGGAESPGHWVGAGPTRRELERRNRVGELTWAQSRAWRLPRTWQSLGVAGPTRSEPPQHRPSSCGGLGGGCESSTAPPQTPAVQEQGTSLSALARRPPTLLFTLTSSSPFGGQHVPSSSPPLPPPRDLDFLLCLSFPLRKSTFQEDPENL